MSRLNREDDKPAVSGQADPLPLESNAYAVAFRLLGNRPAAQAVAGIAAERVRQISGPLPRDWMPLLIEYTVSQTVGPASLPLVQDTADSEASLRSALRRRLDRATRDERVVGSLVHLSGYSVEQVADMTGLALDQVIGLARVLAPPPGIHYRDLGDPELTGGPKHTEEAETSRFPRPRWSTIIIVAIIIAAVVFATQVTGPRPTLEEGGLGVTILISEMVVR